MSGGFSKRACLRTAVLVDLIICLLPSFAQSASNQSDQMKMLEIRQKAKEYCRRLADVALDFVCLEEVSEKYIERVPFRARHSLSSHIDLQRKHTYLYDYQFFRKNGRKVENRILLKQEGREIKVKVTFLQTRMFVYKNVLFGPINLLAEDRQLFFNYKMIGNEILDGRKTVVIEAIPKPGFRKMVDEGKIWVDEKNFSILKIEWNHDRMTKSAIIQDMAERYKGEPRITQIMEFRFEKNGIRFPSRYFIEEAYIKKKGKKIVHSETVIIYKDYKFFTVETEVKHTQH